MITNLKGPIFIRILWSLSLFFLLVSTKGESSSNTPIRSDLQSEITINPYLKVYHTPDNLNGSQAWERIQNNSWIPLDEQINPGMDYPKDVYWITFDLNNSSSEEELYYIEIDFPQIDFIQLYQIDSTVNFLLETGDSFNFSQRPVEFRNFILPISLSGNSENQYLLLLDKRFSMMRFPMTIYHSDHFTKVSTNSNLKYSVFFSFLTLVILLAITLGIILRHKTFASYAFYVFSFGMWLFTSKGLTYQLLIPEMSEFNKHLLPFCSQLTIFALVIYVQNFFQTKKYLPKFHSFMDVILVIFSVGFCFWIIFPDGFIEYARILFPVNFTLTLIVVVFTVFSAIFYAKIDRLRSRMFLIAYSLFFLSIVIQISSELGGIDISLLPADPIITGFLLEVTVLSVAMGLMLKKMLEGNEHLKQTNSQLNKTVEVLSNKEQNQKNGFITLHSKAVINLSEIIYVSTDDHYLEFHLNSGKKEIDRNTLSSLKEEMPDSFIQIHRSILLNIDYLKAAYSDKVLLKDETVLKVSRKYKAELHTKVD